MRSALAVLLLLLVAASAGAADVTTRVRFKPGQSSATYRGTVKKPDKVVYLIDARKGQTLSATISGSTENNDVVFSITSPSGRSLMGEEGEDYGGEWTGRLEESGEHRLEIGMIESERSRFTLIVALE